MIEAFPHFGIFAQDLERSVKFYVDGLGFEKLQGGRAEGVSTLLGIPGAIPRTQFVRHPSGNTFELWTLEDGTHAGDGKPAPANRRGMSHLCMVVKSLDEAAARIVEFGGSRLDESRIELDYGYLMFCADPDGVRIEIIEMKNPWPGYDKQ